jgi:uncharacterized cupredoxin-like copper-binding protein
MRVAAKETNSTHRRVRLFLIAACTAAAMLPLRPAQARPLAGTEARSTAPQVTVVMKEFRFVLSTRSVRTGTVVFRLVNRGHVAHDFKMAGKKSALIAPTRRGVLRVVFRRAGSYPYVCTVPGHAQAGMKGVLRVRR